jgi:translation initiation factor 2B subunit (eIF-2B alpha/beta/delta family)
LSEVNREQINKAIEQIESDNRSGAAEMLSRAAELFSLLDSTAAKQSRDVESTRSEILHICYLIATAQPFMASLMNLATAVVGSSRARMRADEMIESAVRTARSFNETALQAAEAATSGAADLICGLNVSNPALLTHSRSSTVLEAFRKAHRAGKRFSVIATESRPIFEGRALAETLAGEGISVTFIADAAVSQAIDCGAVRSVLVGADLVEPHFVTNKTGTRMIALAARERGVPIYAVCDTSKFISAPYPVSTARKRRDPAELWPDAPQGVHINNIYFEPTPLEYFAGIITEDGALRPDEARSRAENVAVDREIFDLASSWLL